MNQKFSAKLRYAFGVVAFLGGMLFAQQASAQALMPEQQAIVTIVEALNNHAGNPGTAGSGLPANETHQPSVGEKVEQDKVNTVIYLAYLRETVGFLKQGYSTQESIDNAYDFFESRANGRDLSVVDTAKQEVTDLLTL